VRDDGISNTVIASTMLGFEAGARLDAQSAREGGGA
jgi:hypothetical protein